MKPKLSFNETAETIWHCSECGKPYLRWEASIVWVRGGPNDYPYLRETSEWSNTRTRSPRRSQGLVAYSTLQPNSPKPILHTGFWRRVWRFRETDPYPCERDHPNYENACPCEGVRPHSIIAGRPSISGRE